MATPGSHDSIADALAGLNGPADESADRRSPDDPIPAAEIAASFQSDETDETQGPVAAAWDTGRSSGSRRRSAPITQDTSGKKGMIVVLLVLGGLMLIPGLWAITLIAGMDVPMADRSGARSMAMMMLISWPIAILLFFFAKLMHADLKRMEASNARAMRR